ncbi:hypothetical protein MTO96_015592 [Rhipicephalus appendiculatus]
MRQLFIVICFTLLIAIATSAVAFKLQEHEGTAKTIIKRKSDEGGAEALRFVPTSDVVAEEASNNAKSSERSQEEIEEYLFGKLGESVKKVVEDIKKSLDNVGKHMEIPL